MKNIFSLQEPSTKMYTLSIIRSINMSLSIQQFITVLHVFLY